MNGTTPTGIYTCFCSCVPVWVTLLIPRSPLSHRLVPEHRSTLRREGLRSSERLTWGWGALPIVRAVSMEELPQAIKVPSEDNLPNLAKSESIYFDTIEAASVVPEQPISGGTTCCMVVGSFSWSPLSHYVCLPFVLVCTADHPCMSLCGHLIDQTTTSEQAHAVFSEHIITFELFREQAALILQDPNLRFLLNGKICPLTPETQAYLIARVLFPDSPGLPLECSWAPANTVDESRETESDFWFSHEVAEMDLQETHDADHLPQPTTSVPIHEPVVEPMPTICRLSSDGSFFRKSLQPAQEDFFKMRLRDGSNDIEFVAHTATEGEVRVSARLYFWPISAKIVIAEIDGAISRGASGRMLTNLLPITEKESSMMHEGAPEFYSRLAKNGYRIVYLTYQGPSRAEWIHSMRRRSSSVGSSSDCALLPNGPVLLSPDRLLASMDPRSVNAQEFKVAALNGLRALFPVEVNPFYAAFGKTYADSVVFTQVGVFPGKVFLVDEGDGRLRHNSLMNFQESYRSVLGMADKMFPPISSDSPHHVIPLSGGVSNGDFGGHADLQRTAAHSSRPLSVSRIHSSEPNLQLSDRPVPASIPALKHDIVASQVRTRSMGDEAYNDVNFWRIRPGYVS